MIICDFQTELENGFINNKSLLRQHKMYEKTYNNSRFKMLLNKEYIDGKYSTLIAKDDSEVYGVVIFEHFEEKETIKFQYKYKKRKFTPLGMLMVYVKPEYRNNGLASEMLKEFEKQLIKYVFDNYKHEEKHFIVNAVDDCYVLANRIYKTLNVSHTTKNTAKNKMDLICDIRFKNSEPFSF